MLGQGLRPAPADIIPEVGRFRPTVPAKGSGQRSRPTAPMLFRDALSGCSFGVPFREREGSHLFRAIYSKRHLNSANSSRRFTPSVSFHRVNHPISWVGRVLVPTRFDHSIASPPRMPGRGGVCVIIPARGHRPRSWGRWSPLCPGFGFVPRNEFPSMILNNEEHQDGSRSSFVSQYRIAKAALHTGSFPEAHPPLWRHPPLWGHSPVFSIPAPLAECPGGTQAGVVCFVKIQPNGKSCS